MASRVIFTPEARDQLDQLYRFIAMGAQDASIALQFVDGIIDYIATLGESPRRGTPREDIRPGLRTTAWKRRVTIAYVVEDRDVVILGIFYAGRNFEALLRED